MMPAPHLTIVPAATMSTSRAMTTHGPRRARRLVIEAKRGEFLFEIVHVFVHSLPRLIPDPA